MKHARRRSDGPTVGSPSVHLQRRTTVVSVIPQSPLADTSTTGRSPTGCVAFRRNGRGLRFSSGVAGCGPLLNRGGLIQWSRCIK